MKNLESDGKIRLQNLGDQTKRQLKKSGKIEPEIQGYFDVDNRTKIGIPKGLTDFQLEVWKAKMITKYNNYDKIQSKARLTGAAKNLMKP